MPNTNTTNKKPSKVLAIPTAALKPGWVILALGASAYVLSETHYIGPALSIILMSATIFQLNQWQQSKKAGSA
jgi:hypothetical protein